MDEETWRPRPLPARSLAVLRQEGIRGWWLRARRHMVRRYLLRRLQITNRRLRAGWYAQHQGKVSIVIPSYNDHRLLRPCLRSLLRTTDPQRTDIVICDDGSPSAEHAAFMGTLRHPNVRVIRRDANGGFARAVNTGIRATAPGSDVVLLKSDTEALDGWLGALLYAASAHDQVGIVGAKLLYPDRTIQSAGSFRNPVEPGWFDHYYRFQPAGFGPAGVPNHVFATTGACMLIRRRVIDAIGVLDDGYSMGFEDVDFCLRAIESGFRILYCPAAVLIHHESATRGRAVGPRELAAKDMFWQRWRVWFESRQVQNDAGRVKIVYVVRDPLRADAEATVGEHLKHLGELGYDTELYALARPSGPSGGREAVHEFADVASLVEELSQVDAIKVATCWRTAEPVWLASLRRGVPAYCVMDTADDVPSHDYLTQDVALSRYRREFHYLTGSSEQRARLRGMGLGATNVGCGRDLAAFYEAVGTRYCPIATPQREEGEGLRGRG